jgi:hypothetical protein
LKAISIFAENTTMELSKEAVILIHQSIAEWLEKGQTDTFVLAVLFDDDLFTIIKAFTDFENISLTYKKETALYGEVSIHRL